MIKYCKSCGKEYSGDFCEHCGYGKEDLKVKAFDKYKVQKPERFMTDEEKQERSELLRKKREQEREMSKKNGSKNRKNQKKKSQWTFIVIALVVFVGVVLLALYSGGYIFQGKDKKEVISTYVSAIEKGDFESYLGTMVEPMADELRQEANKMGISDAKAIDELYSDYNEGFGEGYTISLEYGTETEMTSDDIKNSQEILKNTYGKDYKIKEAYKVATTLTFKGSKAEETVNWYFYIAKIKNDWYILNIDG